MILVFFSIYIKIFLKFLPGVCIDFKKNQSAIALLLIFLGWCILENLFPWEQIAEQKSQLMCYETDQWTLDFVKGKMSYIEWVERLQ